jgi:hypothetical protein
MFAFANTNLSINLMVEQVFPHTATNPSGLVAFKPDAVGKYVPIVFTSDNLLITTIFASDTNE